MAPVFDSLTPRRHVRVIPPRSGALGGRMATWDCRYPLASKGTDARRRARRDISEPNRWMSESVLTLEDVWPGRPRAMIVGLNPAPASVAVGHYYQGRSGQRQLLRLADAGLFRRPEFGSTYFEQTALDARVGFTDMVKRPTHGEKEVSQKEIEFGREALNTELEARDVPLVICVFRHPVTALLGTSGTPGFQEQTTRWGARVPHAGTVRVCGGGQSRDGGPVASHCR